MSEPLMKAEVPLPIVRIGAGILGSVLMIFPLLVVRNQIYNGFDPLGATFGSAPATAAAICWWFAVRAHSPNSRVKMAYAAIGGLVVGGVGFGAGFFGPLIFSHSNQGPLLGIFLTGPGGFTLGALLGAIVGFFRDHSVSGQNVQ